MLAVWTVVVFVALAVIVLPCLVVAAILEWVSNA